MSRQWISLPSGCKKMEVTAGKGSIVAIDRTKRVIATSIGN
jgi:hypothetical protein